MRTKNKRLFRQFAEGALKMMGQHQAHYRQLPLGEVMLLRLLDVVMGSHGFFPGSMVHVCADDLSAGVYGPSAKQKGHSCEWPGFGNLVLTRALSTNSAVPSTRHEGGAGLLGLAALAGESDHDVWLMIRLNLACANNLQRP